MGRIDVLRKQMERIEERERRAQEELDKIRIMTHLEKVRTIPTLYEHFKDISKQGMDRIIKDRPELKPIKSRLLEDFIKAYMEGKTESINEFLKQQDGNTQQQNNTGA